MMMMMMSRYSKVSAFVLPRIRPTTSATAVIPRAITAITGSSSSASSLMRPTTQLLSSTTTSTRLFSATTEEDSTTSSSAKPAILKRVKTIDAVDPTEDPVVVKGWVRTIRKQKTLAFVQVNDGSTLKGIQCVVSFDDIDETTKKGM